MLRKVTTHSFNTIVIGSGAAGLNAADCLWNNGQKSICIITEGMSKGTSKNAGSDKQTYYRLSTDGDSVDKMTKDYFSNGSMHGDLALAEAANSSRCFYKLVELGVPFVHNEYGEFAGYKTDHASDNRAVSAGPYTSKFMVEALTKSVLDKKIKIFEGFSCISLLSDGTKVNGIIAINTDVKKDSAEVYLFNAKNVILATGAQALLYKDSVYPKSQTGILGMILKAGAEAENLMEAQFGIASVKHRWNLSGSYQQVIPRYISTDAENNDPQEFLEEYYEDKTLLLNSIFLKGYQWPFHADKAKKTMSSYIDLLIYNEIHIKKRKVFLDFTKNPLCLLKDGNLDFSLLSIEAREYLEKRNSLLSTPIERLKKLNAKAIEVFSSNNIDISTDPIEIAISNQHINGGLAINKWYESNLKHLFPVGEIAATFGVSRPGGSALNSTQVASFRASQFICENYKEEPDKKEDILNKYSKVIDEVFSLIEKVAFNKGNNVFENRKKYQSIMSEYGGIYRNSNDIKKAIEKVKKEIDIFETETSCETTNIVEAFRNKDILLSQLAYLASMDEYISNGGLSKGAYLINEKEYTETKSDTKNDNCIVTYRMTDDKNYETHIIKRRPIPEREKYFENIKKSN